MPGVEVEAREKNGRTPLMVAALFGSEEIVKVMVEVEGIDLDTKGNEGWSLEDVAKPWMKEILREAREKREEREREGEVD